MYTLSFIVNGNRLSLDPKKSDNIPMHAEEPIVAYFQFSSEWKNTTTVIGFFNSDGECPPQILDEDLCCMVPSEALNGYWFRVQILGEKRGTLIQTNKLTIVQNGG